eukprot:gene16052-7397_t
MSLEVFFVLFASVCQVQQATSWGYSGSEGPANWYKSYPTCNKRRQSPIHLLESEANYKSFSPFQFTGYGLTSSSNFQLENNGHTLQMSLKNWNGMSVRAFGKIFRPWQIHFHWGATDSVGSEHSMKYQNSHLHPGEMHFVHVNTAYDNVSVALTKYDGLMVFGTVMEIDPNGKNNSFISKLTPFLSNITLGRFRERLRGYYQKRGYGGVTRREVTGVLPEERLRGYSQKRGYGGVTRREVTGVLPEERLRGYYQKRGYGGVTRREVTGVLPEERLRGYYQKRETKVEIQPFPLNDAFMVPNNTFYHYNGSLTTPPCSEAVQWVVFTKEITISHAQMTDFRKLLHHKTMKPANETEYLSNNYRPIQQRNGRTIYRSFKQSPSSAVSIQLSFCALMPIRFAQHETKRPSAYQSPLDSSLLKSAQVEGNLENPVEMKRIQNPVFEAYYPVIPTFVIIASL